MVRSVLAAPSKCLLALVLLLVAAFSTAAATAQAASTSVVISEFRVRGPNGGNDEFVELYNLSGSPVSIGGWKVRGSNSAGTVGTRATITAGTTLGAGCHYLVTNSSTTAGPYSGAVAGDQTYTTGIADDGGIAVTLPDDTVVDQVGMSTGSAYKEGTTLTNLGTTNLDRSYERKPGGAAGSGTDTDNNSADFQLISPSAPQNSAPAHCIGVTSTPPSGTGAATPASVPPGGSTLLTVAVTPGSNPTSTGLAVSGNLTPIGGSASQSFFDDGTNGDATAGDGTFSYQATVASGTSPGSKTLSTSISDAQGRSGSAPISLTVASPTLEIAQVQGAGHLSPFAGQAVTVEGVVTARRSNGYYIQDPSPDASDATSDGILVFTTSAPPAAAAVGALVRVSGNVVEFRPGGASSTNLTITEITGPTTTPIPGGGSLPAPTVIGAGGRVQPTTVIEDDAAGSVETSGAFDPAQDGIDFYESLEGMRVQVNNAVVVGPRNNFGELFVLADNGAGAAERTARGGIVIRDLDAPFDYASGDFNPERIQLDDAAGTPTPNVSVGDNFTTAVVGVLDYDFGNFEVEVTSALTRVDNGLAREVTAAPSANELSVATFNVENLDAAEPQSKFDAIAAQIVTNLRSPDVVSLEEIQDNNGATNDSVVDASQTLTKLVNAISAAGGPTYDYRQINPVDDQDGGEPGGNIRVGFIFRTDRGLAFVDRPGGGSTTPTTIVSGPDGPQLSASPGRVDPTNPAWNASRKPLAGEFTFRGETFFLVTNHFNSKGGDQPLFGRFQPPNRTTEVQRHQQAQIVNNFADAILAVDPNANVVVLGDINDFEFSQTMAILEGGVMTALMKTLPLNERYSYVFEGNSQSLDHIVVSDSLFGNPFAYDAVHVNAEFFDQLSDHDPQVARFLVNTAPTADAGGPYTVAEGGSVALGATGSDANGDSVTYEWDLDNNGTFETSGQTPTFSAASLDGPSTHTIAVRVGDGTATTTDTATVNVTNVAPSATLNAPATTSAGFPFTISLTGASDPSPADTAAGFEYAFDCGDGSGYGAFGSSSSATCPTTATGTPTVGGKIRDKDGGVREYTATVQVVVTFTSLCDLVRAVVTSSDVADGLCDKLAAAASADARGNQTAKASHLQAFRNQVDAQTGKSISAEDATMLKQLSSQL